MILSFEAIFIVVMGIIVTFFNKKVTDILVKIYTSYLPFAKRCYKFLINKKLSPSLARDLTGFYELEKVYPSRGFYIACRVFSILCGIFLIILGLLNIFGIIKTLL